MSLGIPRIIARVGDTHLCPIHGPNVILEGAESTLDGRRIARVGDKCACGCEIMEGAESALLDGRRVAYLGCKTTSGGVIVKCRGSATVC